MTKAKRPGRRPGDPEITRRAVLAAARTAFGELGYERATIREIAGRAGVDPALVHHYFGTKQALFARAHELPFDPAELIARITAVGPGDLGREIVRVYLTVVGAPDSPVLSLIRAAATNESAARMMREFIEDLLLSGAGRWIGAANARLRLMLIGSHMIGVVFARSVVGIPTLAAMDVETLIEAIGPTIDRYLTDPALDDL
jgi:AcrR family transcriptional regulator